jgi:hypothetical protein
LMTNIFHGKMRTHHNLHRGLVLLNFVDAAAG